MTSSIWSIGGQTDVLIKTFLHPQHVMPLAVLPPDAAVGADGLETERPV